MEVIQDLVSRFSEYTAAITIIFAVLNCFFGYRLLRLWIGIAGFAVGLLAGFGVGMKAVQNITLALLIGAVVGAVCTFFAFRAYQAGIFIMAFLWIYTVTELIPQPAPGEVWRIVMMGVGLLLSLIGAAGAVKFTRPVVIGLSAFSGGTKAVHTLLPVFGVANPTILWVGGLLLAVAGGIWQLRTGKRRR